MTDRNRWLGALFPARSLVSAPYPAVLRLRRHALGCILLILTVFCAQAAVVAAETPVVIPPPALDDAKSAGPPQVAVLAGGCFWGVQAVFQRLQGVQRALSGYSGGEARTADYRTVSTGQTGHAESVQITFDPAEISYGQILQVFFSVVHNPTQLNRQGPDIGTQYRSAIFYANDRQREIATAYIAQLEKAQRFPRPIVTRVEPLKGFYPAEAYHQDYLLKHPTDLYIVINDQPKVRNLQQIFPALYRGKAMTAGPIS
jgi:peptide-methionine (S)-S-oxide reductase